MENDIVSMSVEQALSCGLGERELVQAMRSIQCHESDIDQAKAQLRAARDGQNRNGRDGLTARA